MLLWFFSPFAPQQTCSHGSACNFIHCFRNPGGDYEWADADKPPPKYWAKKMAVLFGYSDKHEKLMEQEASSVLKSSRKLPKEDSDGYSFNFDHFFLSHSLIYYMLLGLLIAAFLMLWCLTMHVLPSNPNLLTGSYKSHWLVAPIHSC